MLQKNGKRKIYISRLNQKKDSKVALVNIYLLIYLIIIKNRRYAL